MNVVLDEGTKQLNEEQQACFDMVMSGVNCFITGGAGFGKSFLLREIINAWSHEGKNVMVVAHTGVAAMVIGGVTIHRGFGLPTGACINEKTMTLKERVSKPLAVADVVVIDEISMVRVDLFDAMVASVRRAEKKDKRHIQLVAVGDFCQLPPILEDKNGEKKLLTAFYGRELQMPYAFLGKYWDECDFHPVILRQVMRQADTAFVTNLNYARLGNADCIPYFNEHHTKHSIPDAVSLYPTNKDVDDKNLRMLNRLPGSNYEFETIIDSTLDRIDRIDIPHSVILKPEARVMVTTNDTHKVFVDAIEPKPYQRDQAKFFNGSLGTVLGIGQYDDAPEKDYVAVHLDSGLDLLFYRQTYSVYQYEVDDEGHITRTAIGTYQQFPLCPAYTVTIHKSQVQTYECANIDPACRSSGQLYVALSRVKSIQGMHLDHKIQPWNLFLCGKGVLRQPWQAEDNAPKTAGRGCCNIRQ